MKWIGQHIVDLIARFRGGVYLEGLTSTSETNVLVVDSTGLVSKTTTFGSLSELEADIALVPNAANAFHTLHSDGSSEHLTTITQLAAKLSSGAEFTGASGVLGLGVSQPTITTLGGVTTLGATGVNTVIASDDVQMYNPVNDGNPQFSIGSSDAERFVLWPSYDSGTQLLKYVRFETYTASTTENDGRFLFSVDEVAILGINDHGLDFITNKGIAINGTDILTDSSGTATLSNIDALDATTIATFETAMESNLDTLSSLTTVGTIGTGEWRGTAISQTYLTGQSGTNTGDETLSSINALDITEVGTISSGQWRGTAIASAYIADDAVTFAKAVGVTPNVFGTYIKLIPSDFVANDDAGSNTRLGIGYVDTAGEADYGMRVSHNNTELFAFVSIPEGMKATHVEVFGRRAKAVEVFEVQINASTMTSKGTGTSGIPSQTIGDEEFALSSEVTSTATNLLAIEVTVTSNSADKVYGGRVKIAAV